MKREKVDNNNIVLGTINKILCFFLGHSDTLVGRSNGNVWGWNDMECKRCKYKSDTLTK